MSRLDGRTAGALRPVRITPNYLKHPAGSCLIEMGHTKVICSASVEDFVPKWMKGSGKGWLTAEYGMLPGCSGQRIQRERLKVGGRTQEIQRLIGRSLRASVDLSKMGECALLIDCDVMDADGGTRTASITGAWVAMKLAARKMKEQIPLLFEAVEAGKAVAAVSVGMVSGEALLDLPYEEDSRAEVDMNIVMNADRHFIEVQGCAEGKPFSGDQLQKMLAIATPGLEELFKAQQQALHV